MARALGANSVGMKKNHTEHLGIRKSQRATLTHLFNCGVAAVKGEASVRNWLNQNQIRQPTHILAFGKAAVSMFEGLPREWTAFAPALIVTKIDHLGDVELGPNVQAIEASHPVPDKASLIAGEKARALVESCPPDSRLLVLVSGGASSLVEDLTDGVEYTDLLALTLSALGDGVDIAEINRRRRAVSNVKGGRLLAGFKGHWCRTRKARLHLRRSYHCFERSRPRCRRRRREEQRTACRREQ